MSRRWPGHGGEAAAGDSEVNLASGAALREAGGVLMADTEKLGVEEISRRLLLEYLLWAESERGLAETVRA